MRITENKKRNFREFDTRVDDFRVVESERHRDEYYIVKESDIEFGQYSDTFTDYGQPVDVAYEDDFDATFINYWTGSNHNTFMLDNDTDIKDGTLLDKNDRISKSILEAFEKYDSYIDNSDGKEEIIDGWLISSHLYSSFEYATVTHA